MVNQNLLFMKRFAILLFSTLLFACASDKKDTETVRDMAVQEVKKQMNLPEGTTFNNENIEVTEETSDAEGIETIYVVKISIKSQDQDGNEMVKTNTLRYEKADDDTYKLASFD